MTDLDQIALDTVEAIARIDPDNPKGGRAQALAQAQCLVRDALQELEEVGAENYTLTQEVDAALEQVIYWRERAVGAEGERYALSAHVERWRAAYIKLTNAEQTQDADTYEFMHLATRGLMAEFDAIADEAPTTSLARMKDERAQAIQQAVKRARMEWAREDKAELDRLKAQWQAEALAEMIAAVPFREELAREMIKHKRDELRRQAEETNNARP